MRRMLVQKKDLWKGYQTRYIFKILKKENSKFYTSLNKIIVLAKFFPENNCFLSKAIFFSMDKYLTRYEMDDLHSKSGLGLQNLNEKV